MSISSFVETNSLHLVGNLNGRLLSIIFPKNGFANCRIFSLSNSCGMQSPFSGSSKDNNKCEIIPAATCKVVGLELAPISLSCAQVITLPNHLGIISFLELINVAPIVSLPDNGPPVLSSTTIVGNSFQFLFSKSCLVNLVGR